MHEYTSFRLDFVGLAGRLATQGIHKKMLYCLSVTVERSFHYVSNNADLIRLVGGTPFDLRELSSGAPNEVKIKYE